jgi:hypothetical protein
MTAPEFARFLQQIYRILWAEAKKYPEKPFYFRRLGIVQSELKSQATGLYPALGRAYGLMIFTKVFYEN